MFKNPIARKLNLYFGITLLIFSFIISIVFMLLFRQNTLKIHEHELETHANSIAKTLSGFMQNNTGGYNAYMRFIGDITNTDVWIIDNNHDLVTFGRGRGMMNPYSYSSLPENAEKIINDVLLGKHVFSEGFSNLLSESTLTVGVPIISDDNNILGAVLLHSPVRGLDVAFEQGIFILLISITLALLVSFGLSLWLSKRFTDPITAKEARDAIALDKIRRDFVANVSHELKTPVTVLRGSLEALVDKVVTDPLKVENYHTQMLSETKFLERLVGDLLDLSRLQNVDFVIEKSEIYIYDLLSDLARTATQIAKQKNITIKLTKTANNFKFHGDYQRLKQMFIIVLNNAIKFSKENDTVEINFDNNCISVKDNGTGIKAEYLPHIFDRFYKARTENNKTGTGLGLAIAKQIADRHNITINVTSTENVGSTFEFTFN